jgi:hypothetical protein
MVKDGRLPGRNVKNFVANEIKHARVNIPQMIDQYL